MTPLLEKRLETIQFPGHPGGQTFYVDNRTGKPVGLPPVGGVHVTLASAMAACVTGRGDLIVVRRGHIESWTVASQLPVFKANVTVRGEGNGNSRPRFKFAGTDDTLALSLNVADVTIENCRFVVENTGLDVVATIAGDDCRIANCEFTTDPLTIVWDKCLVVTGDNVVIEDNVIHGSFSDGAVSAIEFNGAYGIIIRRNIILGDYTTAVFSGVTSVTARLFILDNVVYNDDATAATILATFQVSTTGVMARNVMYSGRAAASAIDTTRSVAFFENYVVDVFTGSGKLVPAAIA